MYDGMKGPADRRGLDLRSRDLLRTLISQHIRDGEPVGSRTLAKASGLDVSAATIRNIMADLEDMGLLSAPHTSAGRVPTAQGYRVFVDSLLQVQSLPDAELNDIRRRMPVGSGLGSRGLGSRSRRNSAQSYPDGAMSLTPSGWKSEASTWIWPRPTPSSDWPPPYISMPWASQWS